MTRPLLASARPTFKIEGNPVERMSVDLISLDVRHDEEGLSALDLVLLNWGQRQAQSAPGFLYFDADPLELGRHIEVSAGDEDSAATVFDGVVTAIAGRFDERRPAQLLVRADDRAQWLRMRTRTRAFEEVTPDVVLSTLAGDHGLSSDGQVATPSRSVLWQVNQSDLGFLREQAKAADGRLVVDGTRIAMAPRRGGGEPPVRLSRTNDLLRFEASADLAEQRTKVRVHGWSVADKAGIHEEADEGALSGEAGRDRTGPSFLSDASVEAVEDVHLDFPTTTAEASSLATTRMRQRGRRFLRGIGETDGTPALRPGSRVELLDLGPWFSGTWDVAWVHHRYDQTDGLRTRFGCERAGRGEGE